MAQPAAPGEEKCTREQVGDSFWTFLSTALATLCGLARPKMLAASC